MRGSLGLVVVLAFFVATPSEVAQAGPGLPLPLVKVTGIQVNSLSPAGNHLVANATVTLNIQGRLVQQNVGIPVTLSARPNPQGGCDILDLRLGPIHLDLLGLIVNLDDCNGGPVVVSITAQMGPNNLLGNLLCSIAGLLNNGVSLNTILGGLFAPDLAYVEGQLTTLLNQVLGRFLTSATAVTPATAPAGQCPILHLEIPGGLHLALLGLHVDTSAICLTISAQSGDGNLLGNLLCRITHLLDNPGKNGKAQQALLKNIFNVLNELGL